MKRFILLPLFALILVSCGQSSTPVVVTSQVTELVTQVVTQQVTQLVTVEVTREIIVTATYSGPTDTPTITPTFTPTLAPSPTVDLTRTDKRDGSFMVGTEISPGVWRSSGGSSSEECWLTIKDFNGDLEDITGELPGATIRIPEGQYIVYIGGGSGNKCTWSFLMP